MLSPNTHDDHLYVNTHDISECTNSLQPLCFNYRKTLIGHQLMVMKMQNCQMMLTWMTA